MPHKRKGARRRHDHAHVSSSGSKQPGLETSFVPFNGTMWPGQNKDGFTLQQVARNTERHHSAWNADRNLRHAKVNFVSAGTFDTREVKDKKDQEDAESALADMSLDSPQRGDTQMEGTASEGRIPRPTSGPLGPAIDEPQPAFVIDMLGSNTVDTGMPPPRIRSASPTPSNSSEEIILFRGRDRHGRGIPSRPRQNETRAGTRDTKIKIIEDRVHQQGELPEEVLHQKGFPEAAAQKLRGPHDSHVESDGYPGQHDHTNMARMDDEDALLADYIENIDNEDSDIYKDSFHRRDLGGMDGDIWVGQTEESPGELVLDIQEPSHHGLADDSELYGSGESSTSNDTEEGVQRILSKNERKSGVRYLVVRKNQAVDQARWIKATKLTSVNSLARLEEFETEEGLLAEAVAEQTSDSDDEDIDHESDDDSEDDEVDDDDDLKQRRIDRMTDEQIARLLTKQEELGMGSTELVLFDDEADIEEDGFVSFSNNAFNAAPPTSRKKKVKARGAKRPRGDFPAAALLADAYDGFDVMEFERPSLKRKPKGRRGKIAFDLSDSELEATVQTAWENDRIKKKERKQHREELRAQGLLGSKNGKPDLKAVYKEGMGIHAVRDEIKIFLMGSNTTLSLPPMDKADRKVVHELANAFNLKSKSLGSGTKRFPVLVKTPRTSVYVESKFAAVEARLTRRFLPRMDVSSKKHGGQRPSRGGGVGNAGVSYRDGDVVGGSAPELGVENKGRAMLEKMGWSTGTALGAINNKGILQPVSHVVKTTKAGLG